MSTAVSPTRHRAGTLPLRAGDAGARRAGRPSLRAEQSSGLSARLIRADKQPLSRADTGNKAGRLTPIYGGRPPRGSTRLPQPRIAGSFAKQRANKTATRRRRPTEKLNRHSGARIQP